MLFLIFSALVIFVLFYNFYWKRRNLPPGPTPWPFLGNTFEIQKYEPGYDAYTKWHKEFGPIHTIWLGEHPVVCISDYDLIVETFIKDADSYIDRPKTPALMEVTRRGEYGVVFIDGDLWREQRRFALHVFRNFGLGKNLMQERVLEEVAVLIEKLQKDMKSGVQEHNIPSYIDIAVGSIINNLLFGYRFDGEKENEFYELKRRVTNFIRASGNPWTLAIQKKFEYAKYLPIFSYYYKALDESSRALYEFFERQVEEHRQKADSDSEPTDFVEAFMREKMLKGAELVENYSMNQLLGMLFDLWLAGQETTSNTLAWGVLYLMKEPEVQAKLHQELDEVIGSDRLITMDDKSKLNYASAVVNEIQRIANLLALNVRHTTSRDVNIRGYQIPAGVTIIPHISVVLYDEKIFPNPKKFDPTRFLDEKGQLKRVDELVPFSVGKRQCLGEGLARMEMFLFTVNIFNQFRVTIVPNKPPSMVRKVGGTISPQPYVCSVENRY